MGIRKGRKLSWALAGLGLAIVALATTLIVIRPNSGPFGGPLPGRCPLVGRFLDRGDWHSRTAFPGLPFPGGGHGNWGNPGQGPGQDPRQGNGAGPGPGPDQRLCPGQGAGPSYQNGPMHGPSIMARGVLLVGGCLFLGGVFLAGLFLGFIFCRHRFRRMGGQSESPHGQSAISLLRHAYAEGKISEEEYRKRLAALKG